MTKTKRWLLIVGAIVAIAVGSLFFLVALADHRAAQAYIQQLTRGPRGPWPKDSVAQAVIVRLNHGVGQRQVDQEAIAAVGAELSALLVNSSVGKYDGSECARNRCALYLYGPDAEALFELVRDILRRSPVTAQASVDLRLGSADLKRMTIAKQGAP
jgi:hypothetical protein